MTRVFRELPGAVAGHDEAVHQVRVAGRRLRVALPLLARKGDGRAVRQAVKVLRRLTRAVGEGRDMDVILGLFQDRLDALKTTTAEQRALLSRLRAARARSRSQVAEDVLDLDIDGLRRNLRRLLRAGAAEAPAALARARALREEEGAALLRGFSQVGERYRPDALHALRRRVRRLRYAAEVEDAVRGEDTRAPGALEAAAGLDRRDPRPPRARQLARGAGAGGRGRATTRCWRGRRCASGAPFVGLARLLHRALLETKPADLALRALMAMARGRSILSRQGDAG